MKTNSASSVNPHFQIWVTICRLLFVHNQINQHIHSHMLLLPELCCADWRRRTPSWVVPGPQPGSAPRWCWSQTSRCWRPWSWGWPSVPGLLLTPRHQLLRLRTTVPGLSRGHQSSTPSRGWSTAPSWRTTLRCSYHQVSEMNHWERKVNRWRSTNMWVETEYEWRQEQHSSRSTETCCHWVSDWDPWKLLWKTIDQISTTMTAHILTLSLLPQTTLPCLHMFTTRGKLAHPSAQIQSQDQTVSVADYFSARWYLISIKILDADWALLSWLAAFTLHCSSDTEGRHMTDWTRPRCCPLPPLSGWMQLSKLKCVTR